MKRPPPIQWSYMSALPAVAWPAVPTAAASSVLSLLFQLDQSQWLAVESLEERQREQLAVLLEHAYRTVPWYRERWDGAPGVPGLSQLPLLSRRDLQDSFAGLRSSAVPPEHGVIAETRTSGSTGAPVRVVRTAFHDLMWRALSLRDHRWHRRELSGTLAAIRRGFGRGSSPSWGQATEGLVETGPCLTLDVDIDAASQLEWLQRHDPACLLTYPSLAAELARMSLERGVKLPGLREVRTLGESLGEDLRALCREAWGVPLVDMYSAEEVGYLALQCPDHAHYHVQSESVIVEILDDAGRPCAPGETGRVVVTELHNFAMPLVRYDIGDYAELGEPCPCGRGLPVLNRILGRTRNMLVAPDGRRYWPSLGSRRLGDTPGIRQHQFVQAEADLVEVRLVADRRLSETEEEKLRRHVLSRLPAGFRVRVAYCERIERGAGGKFEYFLSRIAG